MKVLKQCYLNYILECHPRVKSIQNVICEQINIDLGLVPLFLAACYDMSIRLRQSSDGEYLIVHDVRYAPAEKSNGFTIDYSIFPNVEKSQDRNENTIVTFEERSKQHCIICSKELPESESKCSVHKNIPESDIDFIQDCVPKLEEALFKLIKELGDKHAVEF